MPSFRFGLGRLDHSVLMLGRAVQGVKLQWSIAGIADIVASTGRDDHAAAVLHVVAIVIDVHLAAARLKAEELVAVLMNFRANLLARLERHQHQLEMLAGIEHPTEVGVAGGLPLDVVMISLHVTPPW